MAKKSNSAEFEKASNDAFDELEHLRLIVFGHAKQELEQKIDALQNQLTNDINNLNHQFKHEITELSQKMLDNTSAIQHSIAEIDEKIDHNQSVQETTNASLSSQIEMAENAGKDDADLLNKRIDEEVAKLEHTVDASIQDIVAQLEKVTSELTSSKTDRKTLAQLLTNMASNLDADN